MRTYIDDTGHEWRFQLGPRKAAELASAEMDLAKPEFLISLIHSPVTRFDLAFAIIAKQAAEVDVDDSAFELRTEESFPKLSATVIAIVTEYLERSGFRSAAESFRREIKARDRIEAAAMERITGERGEAFVDRVVGKVSAAMDSVMDEAITELQGETDASVH